MKPNGIEIANVTATNAAAVTNHFSCSRSSPTELRNRITTLTKHAIMRTGKRNNVPLNVTVATIFTQPATMLESVLNGCDHVAVAKTSEPKVRNARSPPASHPMGRQRVERRCPSGKSRNRNSSMQSAMGQVQFDTQAAIRPAGSDPDRFAGRRPRTAGRTR